ncbi:hypothetical protein D3C85_1617150 [compost metagenome]
MLTCLASILLNRFYVINFTISLRIADILHTHAEELAALITEEVVYPTHCFSWIFIRFRDGHTTCQYHE